MLTFICLFLSCVNLFLLLRWAIARAACVASAEPAQDVPPLCRDESGENLVKCLDAGGSIRADKTLEYPEVLLEGQIKDLQPRKRIFGGGQKKGDRIGKGDKDVETFRQGDIGPIDLGLFD